MRLYSTTGASGVDSGGVHYGQADDGGFDLPDEVSEHLHSCHVGGKRAWQTYAERHAQLMAEELERRHDPASLLAAVEKIMAPAPPAEDVQVAGDDEPRP